jgi:hypothetical protein
MSHCPDRVVGAVSSKEERNCTSTLHRCFIAVETAGNSRNSRPFSPEKSCFNGLKQVVPKVIFFYLQNNCAVSLPLKQQKCLETPAADFLTFTSSVLTGFSITDWTSHAVLLSGKTGKKPATFRLFFRLSPSNRHGQTPSRED